MHVSFPPKRVEQNLRPLRARGMRKLRLAPCVSAAACNGAALRLVAVPQIFVRPTPTRRRFARSQCRRFSFAFDFSLLIRKKCDE
jgi:hypothetical protein